MEDPIGEWKIQEDTQEEKSYTAGWVLNKGLGLGKKILVTGFVISSAPLVLPPLLILSAFGFAVSVPYGILFASYACTETLMSKFLPNPLQPPLLLGYETVEEDEEEENVGFGVGGEIDMEEKEWLMEYTNGGVERRIELGEKGNEEANEGKVLVGSDYGQGSEEEGGKILKGADEIVCEDRHEEDVGKYVDKREEKPSDDIEAKIEAFEGMGRDEEEELVVDDIDMQEEEELMEDTKGGVERRIECGEKGNEEVNEGKVLVGGDYGQGSEEEGGQILKGANEIVDEDRYEEEVGKWVDKGEEKPSDEIEVRIEAFEGMGEEEEEEEEVVVEDIDMEEEDEELMEDAKGGVERRIELGEKGNEELGEGKVLVGSNYGQGREEGGQIFTGANEIEDEDGYEEDVGKCVDKGAEKSSDEIEVNIEEEVLVGEEEEEEESKGEEHVEETPGSGVVIEGEEIDNGNIEVQAPPLMRSVVVEEESRGEQPVEEMPKFVVVIDGEEIDNGNNEEQPPPLMRSVVEEENGDRGRVNDIEEEELVRAARGLMEKNMDEGEVDYAKEEDNGSVKMMHGGTEEYNNVGNVEEMGIPLEARGAREAVEGKNDDEVPKESEEMPDPGKEENVDNAPNELKPIKKAGDKLKGNNVDTNLEAEKPEVETRETINFGSAVEEEHKCVVHGEATLQEGIKEEELMEEEEEEEEEGVVEENRGEQPVAEPPGFVVVIEGEERDNDNNEEQASPVMRSVVMEENGNRGSVNDIEEGELVRQTRVIMGENRDESKIDYAEEEDQGSVKMIHGGTKEENHKNVVNVEEMEIPLEARGAGEDVEGKNDEEVPKESEEIWEPGKVENLENTPNELKPIEKAGDKLQGKNVDNTLEAEKPEVETRETINFGSNVEEEHKPVVHGEAMLQEGIKEDSIANGVDEDIQLNRERENASFSNTGAREIADESGFVLFNDKKVAGQQYMYAGYVTPEESEQSSSCISHGSGDFMELPVSAKVPDSKRATSHSKKDNIMPLNEVSLGKKSWQEPSNEIEVKIEAFEEMGEEEEEEGVIEESRGKQQVEETLGFVVVIEGEEIDNLNNEEQAAHVEESRGVQPVEEMPGFVVVIEGEDVEKGNIEVQAPPVLRSVVVEESGDRGRMNDIEEEELVRETRGIMGKKRDESKADYAEEEDQGSVKMMDGGTKEGYLKNFGNVEEMEIPLEARVAEETVEEKNDEEVRKESEEMRKGKIENVGNAPKELKLIKKAGDKVEGKNVDTNLEAEKPVVERREAINFDSVSEKEHRPFEHREAMLREGIIDDSIANGVAESVQLNREKENVSFSNADAREIADESGFELFYDKKVAGQQYMHAGYETPEESEQSSSCISLESGDFLELPVSARVPESKIVIVHSKRDNIMPSNEAKSTREKICSEEKIWEQINGLKTIVGYKAEPHANCLAELKALYIFTGVEPPASVEDPSDLVEVNNKLQFLMSIVGVK